MAKKLTTAEFIERANKKHGNHYDYSRVKYINSKTDVEIGCRIHKNYFFGKLQATICREKGVMNVEEANLKHLKNSN